MDRVEAPWAQQEGSAWAEGYALNANADCGYLGSTPRLRSKQSLFAQATPQRSRGLPQDAIDARG